MTTTPPPVARYYVDVAGLCNNEVVLARDYDLLAAECERLRKALEEAEQSLRTIAKFAGREELETFLDVRGYANSRATVARRALTPTSQETEK